MVAYKPAAAFIYYIGFSYLSSPAATDAGSTSTMIAGIMVLLLAVPVLLKFCAWSGTQIGGGVGGGSGFLGAVGAVAMNQGYGRGAVDRAAAMEANGPGSYATFGQYPPMTGAIAPTGAAPTAGGAGAGAVGAAAAGVAAAGTVGAAAVRTVAGGMTGGSDGGGDPT